MRRADDDEQRQRGELDHDHDVVRAGALAHAAQEQPRDDHHDRERRKIDEDGHAKQPWRRLEQPVFRESD